jgi:hypothetical protein
MDYLVAAFVCEFPDDDSFDDWEPKPDRQRLLWSIRLFCLVNLPLYRLMRLLKWMQPMRPDSWFNPRQHSLGLGLLQREIGRWERLQNGEGLLWQADPGNWDDVSWDDFQEMFPEVFEDDVADQAWEDYQQELAKATSPATPEAIAAVQAVVKAARKTLQGDG